ncbi:uncharacterized protein LOC130647207 [Hydractinia symbiolongicarpus]|uniref:uncharacterized protein LOC130647207 n=1 Tax=Hydractinia symbiolongicarpus TaxID=13093 RepID=UPI00254E0A66|nr:uncharacterized protein LOC130647207 [Hydractinia symbiolongicarpus]
MFSIKGKRQRVKVSHTPSMINQKEDLYVDIPNMGMNNVICPGFLKLLFDLEITGTNTNRTIVNNIGKTLVRDLRITLNSREVQNISDYSTFAVYRDLWLPRFERENELTLEGIGVPDGATRQLQVKSTFKPGDGEEKAIAKAYGNTFCIPLGKMFELTRDLPFYQAGLHDRLQFVLHFAPYRAVIKDEGTPRSGSGSSAVENKPADATYKITNITLEFDKVYHEGLASTMVSRHSRLALPYERVLRSKVVKMQKANTSYTVEGEPNELYSYTMLPKDHFKQVAGCLEVRTLQ